MYIVYDLNGFELFLTEDYEIALNFCWKHGLGEDCIREY